MLLFSGLIIWFELVSFQVTLGLSHFCTCLIFFISRLIFIRSQVDKMVESLFNLARNEFFSMRIITEIDVAQIQIFKRSLYNHYLAMDASVKLLQNRHLSATTILARLALQLNTLLSQSRDSEFDSFSEYVEFFLPQLQDNLQSFIQVSGRHETTTCLNLNEYTLWSDFDFISNRDRGGFLFTLESSRSHVVRTLCAARIMKPNLYRLVCAKVSALVIECQRLDDLIHSYVSTIYQCTILYEFIKSDLNRLVSYLERPRVRVIRVCVGRHEFERSIKDVVREMYRKRFQWVSPEEKISRYYCHPRAYYLS